MKAIYVLIGSILVVILISTIYLFNQFSKTTWGGWRPPSTELELSASEIKWKYQIEKRYNCHFDYIGLDGNFMEDSIIYMNIRCDKNSSLQFQLCDSLELITEKLSQSFLKNATGREKQTCIQYSFKTIFCQKSNPPSKHPTLRESLYFIKKGKVIKLDK